MINIDNTFFKSNNHPFIFNYRFPLIDFKFQNTGNATALLWKFVVSVTHTEIDISPTFTFHAKVESNELCINATNNGWGNAHDCLIQVDEITLNRTFRETVRQCKGTFASGENKNILRLSKSLADTTSFEQLERDFQDLHMGKASIGIRGIKIDRIKVFWHCKDDKDISHSGSEEIFIFNYIGLNETGFFEIMLSGGGFPSDTIYGVIIDPLQSTHDKEYSISRKVLSGDVERFHIMIGSTASCHIKLNFKFYVGNLQVIETEPFHLSIWNPKNSGWDYQCKEALELRRDIEEAQGRLTDKQYSGEYWVNALNSLKQKAEIFPFLNNE